MTAWGLAATLLLPTAAGAAAPAEPIEVTVTGVRSAAGVVHVDVCPEANFLDKCPYSIRAPARVGSVTVLIHVPPGRYAVQAFHDANGNDKVDLGIFSIPREGIGFSNDAMAHLARPKFRVAAFDHGPVPQRVTVKLRYFLG